MKKILYISSEAFPLIKTGGLGDVAGSLPPALLKLGLDVRLLLPAYPDVIKNIKQSKIRGQCSYYNQTVNIIETRMPGTKLTVWLIDCPAVFDRPGGPYTDHHGEDWHDNAFRFSIFCHAAVDIALNKLSLDWQPDIVHCNDWQTGLVPALLSLQPVRPASIFTIHNLAYQGVFDQQTFTDLKLPEQLWSMEGLEFYNQLSFIKGGLVYADKINTVSPNYAREILQQNFGYGLDGLLNKRKDDLSGILNGIDHKHWNPGSDNLIAHKYNRHSLAKKSLNKTALQQQLELPVDENIPMLGMVSRLVEQKGLPIIVQNLTALLKMPLQIVILGTGETHYEIELSGWAQKHPQQMKVIIGYSEELAHKIEAASDIYLMPSNFEPCGLNQLYSLRYGTLPVVTNVGGLADTVNTVSESTTEIDHADGFMVKQPSAAALLQTLKFALKLYQNRASWRQLQLNAMSKDFSWQSSATHYLHLYQQALQKK
ncbi:MAG: glycogen synthase GlgA [Gammaproteobacteria bacterium]|nr:glycogen synthase GlgA [Gammaproteobacteria bacterium]